MQRAQKDLQLTYGTPNCLNYFGPCFLRLLHVRKRRWKGRASQNKHPIYQGGEAHSSWTSERTNSSCCMSTWAAVRWEPLPGPRFISTDVATLTRKKQREKMMGVGGERPLPSSKENSARSLPLSSWKFQKAALSWTRHNLLNPSIKISEKRFEPVNAWIYMQNFKYLLNI